MSCIQCIFRAAPRAILRICSNYHCLPLHHIHLSVREPEKASLSYRGDSYRSCGSGMSSDVFWRGTSMKEIIFQNKLRVARAEKRISQGELADMVGVSRQTISSIENNQFCPSAKLALLLCIALDKSFEELFFFE